MEFDAFKNIAEFSILGILLLALVGGLHYWLKYIIEKIVHPNVSRAAGAYERFLNEVTESIKLNNSANIANYEKLDKYIETCSIEHKHSHLKLDLIEKKIENLEKKSEKILFFLEIKS